MNCGDIEGNPGVLDQCYSNNNFVTTAVLGVRNYVLLETRLREFNRTAVDVGGVGDLDFECDMCQRRDACFTPVCMQSLV